MLKRVPYGQTRCLSFEFPLPDDQAPASDLSNQAPATSACEQRWRSASLSVESGGWFGLYAKSPLTEPSMGPSVDPSDISFSLLFLPRSPLWLYPYLLERLAIIFRRGMFVQVNIDVFAILGVLDLSILSTK